MEHAPRPVETGSLKGQASFTSPNLQNRVVKAALTPGNRGERP
jgi:hypothetical protein